MSTIASKQTATARSPGCSKNEQNKFESYGDKVDQAFSLFHRNSISNQNTHRQIENDETPGTKNSDENESGDTEKSKTSAITNFIPKILPDDEIAEGINSLKSKQRKVFNVVFTGGKDYVPVDIFLSGSGGTGKSHLMKVIQNAISKHCFIIVRTLKK